MTSVSKAIFDKYFAPQDARITALEARIEALERLTARESKPILAEVKKTGQV
ncbi:hypothetical protein SAMN05421688_2128 [Poseidonocella pacifica]|uniref:Uncharacterized protein n=1 Tax=Poseidonocella pacifica TaxID=871651 RepID=A0A1I0XCD6_9RHOB|nr:hypothetical protein [Poseidonocella pacifica]SFA98712.1 hypothetical protein SAMN05421688_2128 [Poseidonocella pacifica]